MSHMERRLIDNHEERGNTSTPGEQHQGTSGATAGSDTRSTGGDRVLRRRAPVRQTEQTHNTRENAEITSSQNPTTSATTTASVSQLANPIMAETTAVGERRVRMKWTQDINLFIMRTFYQVTQLETNMTAYREKIHRAFVQKYPSMPVSQQRVADQRRTIVKNKLLSDEVLERIKAQVRTAIGRGTEEEAQRPDSEYIQQREAIITTTAPENGINSNPPTDQELAYREDDLEKELVELFKEATQKYLGMDPTKRPWIPKQKTSQKFAKIVDLMNTKVLPANMTVEKFEDLHDGVYCAAITAAKCNGAKIKETGDNKGKNVQPSVPPWKIRLQRKIETKRAEIARLNEYKRGRPSRKLERKVHEILEKYKIHTPRDSMNEATAEFLDTLQQKLAVLSSRLKRYTKCTKRKQENSRFYNNEKKFYKDLKNLSCEQENTGSTPEPNQINDYWSSIWTRQGQYNREAHWLQKESEEININQMEEPIITRGQLTTIINALHNWKSPGSDNIHNFWYKKLTCLHEEILRYVNHFISNPQEVPVFLTAGKTYLLPKKECTTDPSKYRPITCLQTFYKIMTSCIADLLNEHIEKEKIMTEEQKGCKKGAKGCKEQLIIDSVILKHAQNKNRNLSCCYVDYQKAYDSVPHAWLLKVLELYKVHPKIIKLLGNLMNTWRTAIHLQIENQTEQNNKRPGKEQHITTNATPIIQITRGIFQGDSLSPIWFCLALNPLSKLLSRTGIGYNLNSGRNNHLISHQLYMDDLKLYAPSHGKLRELIVLVEQFSNDIGMKFGLDKCKVINIKKGKYETSAVQLESGGIIEAMDETDVYKYLGYAQARNIRHREIKDALTNEYMSRIRRVCQTDLNSKNMFKAINTLAIPILTYSFGIIQWTETDIENIMRKTRVELTRQRKLHPKSSTIRISLPRNEGGRGLIDIKNLCSKQLNQLREYFYGKKNTSILHQRVCEADKDYTPLNLANEERQINENVRCEADKLEEWRSKPLHGRHAHDLNHTNVDKTASNAWLRHGQL
ncbi:hypothetical protein M8J77_010139 [Diaphorina citri]|nr:hypothetical protein M8J77_010139 [Diaphorina citri]